MRYTFSRSLVVERTWPFFLDLTVAMGLLAGFYAVLQIARYWLSGAVPEVVISQSPRMLPLYAFYSCVRIGAAYLAEPAVRRRLWLHCRLQQAR